MKWRHRYILHPESFSDIHMCYYYVHVLLFVYVCVITCPIIREGIWLKMIGQTVPCVNSLLVILNL